METNKKLKFPSAETSVEFSETIDKAIKKAVREALLKHKQAGNSVAIWRDGQVILLQPEEISPEDTAIS